MSDPIDYSAHAKQYDEASFRKKLEVNAKTIGKEIVEKALWLFYSAQSPNTPAWAKTTIFGTLAYLVFPADVVPDFLPVVGFADDSALILVALSAVAFYIDDDVKAKATVKLCDWFGDVENDVRKPASEG